MAIVIVFTLDFFACTYKLEGSPMNVIHIVIVNKFFAKPDAPIRDIFNTFIAQR